MKGANNTKKFFNIWQKTTEERKQLVDQEKRKASYGQPASSPGGSFRKPSASNSGTIINNRNASSSKYLSTPSTSRTLNSQKLSTTSVGQATITDNTSSDDVFDDNSLRSHSEYNNPVFNWVNESPVVSIRSDNHPTNNVHSTADFAKVEFNKLPFVSYHARSRMDKWRSAILQGLAVTLGLALIPFIIMVIIFIVIKTRFRPKMSRVEKRKETIGLCILLVVTLMRDLIIVVIVLSQTIDTSLSIFRTTYPLVLFLWPLTFCCFPAASFYFGDCQYEFGMNPVKKVCAQLASHFSVIKALPIGNVDIQSMYFNKHYPMISAISGSNDEFPYVKSVTSKVLLTAGIITAIITSVIRVIPLLLETLLLSPSCHIVIAHRNATANGASFKSAKTQCFTIYVPIVITSSLTLFFVSLFFSVWILYVVFWNVAVWNEWRSFNSNESDDDKTLLNKGPQSTASWWKIRQTLILFSESSICASSLTGKVLYVTCSLVCIVMSVALIIITTKRYVDVYITTVISLLIDDVLLYLLTLVIYLFYFMIEDERKESCRLLDTKKVNIGYEIACMMNLEQEFIDRDPNIRNRLRLLRGRLLLMQEMVSTVKLEDDSRSTVSIKLATFAIGVLIVISSIYSVKFFMMNI